MQKSHSPEWYKYGQVASRTLRAEAQNFFSSALVGEKA